MDVRRLLLGILLMLIGLALLGVRQGWLPEEIWSRIVDLWPLLLVYWGARMVWRAWQREHSDASQAEASLSMAPPAPPATPPIRRPRRPYEGLVGGTLFLSLGLVMLGAELGWWDWDLLMAAPFLGLGFGMVLRAFLPSSQS